MICRERDGAFIMVEQHAHGLLAGELALWFRQEPKPEQEQESECTSERDQKNAPAETRREEVLWAVAHHDRGWIDLDETPFWNDAGQAPYSFIDFPVAPKLTFYTRGLNEIEAHTPYGALLCSLHFERLIEMSGEKSPELDVYCKHEQERRARIRRELAGSRPIGESELFYDRRLLQFCDDLSLYLALNEPGSPKAEQHPWWKDGFAGSEDFGFTSGRRIIAEWKDKETLVLDPFPFTKAFDVSFKLRRVPTVEIAAKGIARAYRDTPAGELHIHLTGQLGQLGGIETDAE